MSKKCLATLSRRRQTGAKVHGVTKSATFLLFLLPSSSNKNATREDRRKKDGSRSGTSPAIRIPKHRRTEAQEDGRRQKKKVLQDYQEAITNKIRLFLLLRIAGGDHSKHTSPCPPYAGGTIEKKGLSLRSGVRAFEGSVSGIL